MSVKPLITRGALIRATTVICLGLLLYQLISIRGYTRRFPSEGRYALTLSNQFEHVSGWRGNLSYEQMASVVQRIDFQLTTIMTYWNQDALFTIESPRTQLHTMANAYGVSIGYDTFRGIAAKVGRFFDAEDEGRNVCVLGEDVARVLGVQVGDHVMVRGRLLEVTGIISEWRSVILLPISLRIEFGAGSGREMIRAYFVYEVGEWEPRRAELAAHLQAVVGEDKEFTFGWDKSAVQTSWLVARTRAVLLTLLSAVLLLFGGAAKTLLRIVDAANIERGEIK